MNIKNRKSDKIYLQTDDVKRGKRSRERGEEEQLRESVRGLRMERSGMTEERGEKTKRLEKLDEVRKGKS